MVAHLSFATWVTRSRSLISSEQPEQFAHGGSFVLSDLSESLTVGSCSFDLSEMSEFPALPEGRFVLWDILSVGHFVRRTFCPMGLFVRGTLCQGDVLTPWECLVKGHFVRAPKIVHVYNHKQGHFFFVIYHKHVSGTLWNFMILLFVRKWLLPVFGAQLHHHQIGLR